jgi:zinc transport system substrate-binding protein
MNLNTLSYGILAIASYLMPVAGFAKLDVVVSVRPLYGIVASIMEGQGEPKLVLQGNESPHTYSLKPSDVSTVTQADLLIWIGESYEVFLKKVIANQTEDFGLITADQLPGIRLHHLRSGGVWGEHSHSHDHSDAHDHHHHHVEGTTTIDGHLWLDIENAKVIAQAVKDKLCQLDPRNTQVYEINLEKFLKKLDDLNAQFRETLRPYSKIGFIVFHDSYQYIEKAYNLTTLGSILVEPESPAQPYHVDLLLKLLKKGDCSCIFSEPQFKADIAQNLSEKTNVPMGMLDPLGTQIPLSPNHYESLMKAMILSIEHCIRKR